MRQVIWFFGVVVFGVIVFGGGYFWGQKLHSTKVEVADNQGLPIIDDKPVEQKVLPVKEPLVVATPMVLGNPTFDATAVPDLKVKAGIDDPAFRDYLQKRTFFRGLSQAYSQQLSQAQAEVTKYFKAAEYLKAELEKIDATASLEASILHETRYRDSLIFLANAERDLIAIYAQIMGIQQQYIDYLESRPK